MHHIMKALAFLILAGAAQWARCEPSQHENTAHKDKSQELIRLRTEGVAHYENGIAQKKALAVFEEAVRLKGDALDYFNLALIYKKLNQVEQARLNLKKAIELDKHFAHPHYVLGLLFKAEGNNSQALTHFDEAAKLMPLEASTHYQLSRLYREMGNTEQSLQSIVTTLKHDPYHTGAMYQLYLYHQQAGNKEKAAEIFTEFSRLKKAIGATRKEINPDEGALAKPIIGRQSELKQPFTAAALTPSATVRDLAGLNGVRAFAVADINSDYIEDIVMIDRDGHAAVAHYDATAIAAKKTLTSDATFEPLDNIQLAKLSRAEPYAIIAPTAKGLQMLKFKNTDASAQQESAKNQAKATELNAFEAGFEKTVTTVPAEALKEVLIFDLDHDGDLDISVHGFEQQWINRGNGEFDKNEQTPSALTNKKGNLALVGGDFRNSIAVDFVIVDADGKRRMLRDDMGGRYTKIDVGLPSINGLAWQAVADMDNDGSVDVVSLFANGLAIDFNRGDVQFDTEKYKGRHKGVSDALVLDYDNDGYKDVLVAEQGGLTIWMNLGERKWKLYNLVNFTEGLKKIEAIDANRDGRLDLLVLRDDGQLQLIENTTQAHKHNWLTLHLDGVRSAADGRFTQLEVRYGGFYSKYEADGGQVHIPLGQADHAELLRISWPNGFVENKFNIKANTPFYFSESERISGSCPSVYAWNGQAYTYITDAFISGPMGVPTGPETYFPVGDDEYVLISGEQLKADAEGNFKVSIVEELKEVTYLDQVKLLVLDHPEDQQIFPNEHLLPPSFPQFKVHSTAHAEPPELAFDHTGRDVTQWLREVDYRYPHDFRRLSFTGFVDNNIVELKLTKKQRQAQHLRLFLTGWFYYFDSTSLMAVAQQPDVEFVWPQVQMFYQGEWQFVEKIGIPSGKEKTVVVDLSGRIPSEVERIRLVTNIELYWDRVLIDAEPEPNGFDISIRELPLTKATMSLHGFSELLRPETGFPMPDRFDYHRTRFESMWNPLDGLYTRYGDVLPLLTRHDSKLAVFGSADEVSMVFSGADLPAPKPGFKRDYFLYLNGFVKDGDKYTAHPGQVSPMPFKGMRSYPIEARELEAADLGEDYQQYLREYQTRKPLNFTGQPRHGAE